MWMPSGSKALAAIARSDEIQLPLNPLPSIPRQQSPMLHACRPVLVRCARARSAGGTCCSAATYLPTGQHQDVGVQPPNVQCPAYMSSSYSDTRWRRWSPPPPHTTRSSLLCIT
eukprot:scaffold285565_cov32-Tisochrysis_lutea.AAC.2